MEVRTRALAMAEEREDEAKRRKLFDSGGGGGGGGGGGEFELSSSPSSASLNQQQQQQQQHKNHLHRRPLVLIKSENIPVLPETRVISSENCSSITNWKESSLCSSEIVMRSADIDPERRNEGFRFKNSMYFAAGDRARREATQSSDLINEESNQMLPSLLSSETTLLRNSSKMPSEAEIESFFSEIEKDEQKRFTERYNYDIVKDVPLEGRFIWVPLKL